MNEDVYTMECLAEYIKEDEEAALQIIIEHEMKEADGLQAYRHLARELQTRQNDG